MEQFNLILHVLLIFIRGARKVGHFQLMFFVHVTLMLSADRLMVGLVQCVLLPTREVLCVILARFLPQLICLRVLMQLLLLKVKRVCMTAILCMTAIFVMLMQEAMLCELHCGIRIWLWAGIPHPQMHVMFPHFSTILPRVFLFLWFMLGQRDVFLLLLTLLPLHIHTPLSHKTLPLLLTTPL